MAIKFQIAMQLQASNPLTNIVLMNIPVNGLVNNSGINCEPAFRTETGGGPNLLSGNCSGLFVQNTDYTNGTTITLSWSQSSADTVGTQVIILPAGAMISFFYPSGSGQVWWIKMTTGPVGALGSALVVIYE